MWRVLRRRRKHLPYRDRDVNFFQTPHLPAIPSRFTHKSVKTWQRFSGVLPPLYIDFPVIAFAVTIHHTAPSMLGSDSQYAELPHSDMAG